MEDRPTASRQLGDYLLREKQAENGDITTWLAEQASVGRAVILEEFHGKDAAERQAFLADARARAAVDHPNIASVLEASTDTDACFVAYERLQGRSLEECAAAGETLRPTRLVRVLHRICEANLNHQAHHRSTQALRLADVFLDEHDVVRLRNLALAGTRGENESRRDLAMLGRELPPLIADGLPGTTRLHTLCRWMLGEEIAEPLGWHDTLNLCEQVDQQLAEPTPALPAAASPASRLRRRILLASGLSLGLLLAAVFSAHSWLKRPDATPKAAHSGPMPPPVAIPAARYPTPDGGSEALPAFVIGAHEVTIGEYAEFLETLGRLAGSGRQGSFDHEDQPADKTDHQPEDWANLFAAAKSGGTWQGRLLTLDTPVVGVDWWDAAAYARWKSARLPSQEEWFAALHHACPDPTTLSPGNWQSVRAETADQTPGGLIGMAGSVSEWAGRPAPDPANPLGPRLWVILGGSHAKAAKGALTREWVDDRSLRRPDLGFRLIYDASP